MMSKKVIWARVLGCVLLTSALVGCGGDGIGGTGIQPDPEGIGGTGQTAGIDGIGGTGIVGVITELGSIVVNGLRITYPDNLAIRLNGGVAPVASLRRGHLVEVLASRHGNTLVAREISVFDAVVGPVSSVDAGARRVRILGQTVQIDAKTRLSVAERALKPGQLLRVSGLRRADGTIVATRIDPGLSSSPFSLSGRVTALGADGFRVGTLWVRYGAGGGRSPMLGQTVFVAGGLEGSDLKASTILRKAAIPFVGRAEHLVLQGYARVGDSRLKLGSFNGSIDPATRFRGTAKDVLAMEKQVVLTASLSANGAARVAQVVAPGAAGTLPTLPTLPMPQGTKPLEVPQIPNTMVPPKPLIEVPPRAPTVRPPRIKVPVPLDQIQIRPRDVPTRPVIPKGADVPAAGVVR